MTFRKDPAFWLMTLAVVLLFLRGCPSNAPHAPAQPDKKQLDAAHASGWNDALYVERKRVLTLIRGYYSQAEKGNQAGTRHVLALLREDIETEKKKP